MTMDSQVSKYYQHGICQTLGFDYCFKTEVVRFILVDNENESYDFI